MDGGRLVSISIYKKEDFTQGFLKTNRVYY